LTRVAIGPLRLGKLKPGEFRRLFPEEVAELQRAARRASHVG
jgi:16S rRNA U516 pseudouridylate synthase RsuA-like enzyme